jgi:hypothetical protein
MCCCQECWRLWANRVFRFCDVLQHHAYKGKQLPCKLRMQHQLLEHGIVADAVSHGKSQSIAGLLVLLKVPQGACQADLLAE